MKFMLRWKNVMIRGGLHSSSSALLVVPIHREPCVPRDHHSITRQQNHRPSFMHSIGISHYLSYSFVFDLATFSCDTATDDFLQHRFQSINRYPSYFPAPAFYWLKIDMVRWCERHRRRYVRFSDATSATLLLSNAYASPCTVKIRISVIPSTTAVLQLCSSLEAPTQ